MMILVASKSFDKSEEGVRARFYCPGCNCYLRKVNEEDEVNKFEVCPNPSVAIR